MRYRSLRQWLILLASCASFVSPPVAAPASSDPALVTAAKEEGELYWSTGLVIDQVVRPIAQGFERKYGIKVKFATYANGGETLLRVTSEARSGNRQIDLFDTDGQIIPAMVEGHVVASYQSPEAAEYQTKYRDPNGYWTAFNTYFQTAVINTDIINADEVPARLEDLLDPKWRGRIAWPADLTVSAGPGFVGAVLATMGREAGAAYLTKLSEQKIANIPQNARAVLNRVVSGDYAIALMAYNHQAAILAAKGAPVRWLKLEPLIEHFGLVAVVKDGPHPNAARLFVDYLLSEEGQKLFRDANYFPTHPKVVAKLAALTPEGGHFKTFVIPPQMNVTELPQWLEIYRPLFK